MISPTTFLLVVLLALVENSIIPTDDTDNRILGGEDASITEFPSMVFLKIDISRIAPGSFGVCGGAIISDRWILTAAHCLEGVTASDITMRVGSENKQHGGSVHRASRIIPHKEFFHKEEGGSLVEVRNDIALVEAEEHFPLDNLTIKAARLALKDEDTPTGTIVTVVGWGLTEDDVSTDILQKANLEINNSQQCGGHVRKIPIDKTKLCAGDSREEKGICMGDSGGPVFKKDVVVGVISTGKGHCVRSKIPNMSTSVAYFRDWIHQNSGI